MFSRKSFSSKSFSTRSWYMGVLDAVVRTMRGVRVKATAQAAVLRTLAAETYTQMRETSVRFTMKRKH